MTGCHGFSLSSSEAKAKTEEYIAKHELAKYIALFRHVLFFESIILYAVLVSIIIIDIQFANKTNLTNISYYFYFLLEVYILKIAVEKFGILTKFETGGKKDEAVQQLLELIETVIDKTNACNDKIKKQFQAPNVKLAAPAALLLCSAIIFNIFSGKFLAITGILILITLPGFIHNDYHKKTKQIWLEKAWPKIKPTYDAQIRPFIDSKVVPIYEKSIKPHLAFLCKNSSCSKADSTIPRVTLPDIPSDSKADSSYTSPVDNIPSSSPQQISDSYYNPNANASYDSDKTE
ncbi:MAG: hypothetical protein EZS28_019877 [Streblomastix strix]|uniref:Reticulon domain-containing protein n=1 Tax=Streblomastix strix TaxID=222440 RepID=A0A5J4VPV7_9EUKA|nr:MAG: hypothetical protein EZS28_019877 [Streblomastix strix]